MRTSFINLFNQQVKKSSNKIAIRSINSDITFEALNQASNQLANYLDKIGIKKGITVVISIEPSIDLFIAILAIIKNDCIYVPVDIDTPQIRKKYIVEHSETKIIITDKKHFNDFGNKCLKLDIHDLQKFPLEDNTNSVITENVHSLFNNNTFYLMYTSGSTGQPKAVIGNFTSTLNRFFWMWEMYPFENTDICLQKTSINFVDSIWEMFGPLLQGTTIVSINRDNVIDTNKFIQILEEYKISRIVVVPSFLEEVLKRLSTDKNSTIKQLKYVISSGEELKSKLVKKFIASFPKVKLINIYGSTEVAADVIYFDIANIGTLKDESIIPIGNAIPNVTYIIQNNIGESITIGEKGELLIGGLALSDGYYKDITLTEEKFITIENLQYFKTGDIVSKNEMGYLLYHGRKDFQVKKLGNRFSLGEIENNIEQLDFVDKCLTIYNEATRKVISYIHLNLKILQEEYIVKLIRQLLKDRLPLYMHPNYFIFVQHFYTNLNGKIDIVKLPKVTKEAKRDYIRPQISRDYLEFEVDKILKKVLKIDKINIDDNFFTNLGGDSIRAVEVVVEIQNTLKKEISIKNFYRSPTIKGIAKTLRNTTSNINPSIISFNEKGKDFLFFLPPIIGISYCYMTLSVNLKKFKSYGLNNPYLGEKRFISLESQALFFSSLIEEKYSIKEKCIIIGWSYGGLLAYEIINILEKKGYTCILVLLDTQNTSIISSNKISKQNQKKRTMAYLESKGFTRNSEYTKKLIQECLDNVELSNNYIPKPVESNTLLIKAKKVDTKTNLDFGYSDKTNGWSNLIKNIKIEHIDCEHQELLDEAHTHIISRFIKKHITNL